MVVLDEGGSDAVLFERLLIVGFAKYAAIIADKLRRDQDDVSDFQGFGLHLRDAPTPRFLDRNQLPVGAALAWLWKIATSDGEPYRAIPGVNAVAEVRQARPRRP